MKFLQTIPQFKDMNINYYDLYHTVIKNRYDKNIIDTQYEHDFIKFNDIVPNHYVGREK